MDLVLVLNLTFLLIRQTLTDAAPPPTHRPTACRPGYRKKDSPRIGQSKDGSLQCEECMDGEYTEIDNTDTECQRCSAECPGHLETIVKNCTRTSDIKCACKRGTYHSDSGMCTRCSASRESCQRTECLNHETYKHKCTTATLRPTTSTNTTVRKPNTLPSNPTVTLVAPAQVSHVTLLILGLTGVMVLCVVITLLQYQSLFPCCNAEKDVEFNAEHQSDQNSSPTTLTFSNHDGTPVITLSPFTPEHPAHIRPLLPPPASQHKVARVKESEHWPAIVLYTIIKEVPLRRWKEFLRLLSVADHQLERVELEAGLGSMERQYQMLRLWSQRPSANMDDIFSALCYMDLSGCAQLLMESLEKLEWRNERK